MKYIDRALMLAAVLVGVAILVKFAVAAVPAPETFELKSATTSALIEDAIVIGAEEPSVTLVVYSTFNCGYCVDYHARLDSLIQRYPDHLAVAYKQFISPESSDARMMAHVGLECAGDQGRYAEYNAAMFENPGRAGYLDGWKTVGNQVGVPDTTEFRKCVTQGKYIDELTQARNEALGFGFTGTPGTVTSTGRKLSGAIPTELLNEIIAEGFRRRNASGERFWAPDGIEGATTPYEANVGG